MKKIPTLYVRDEKTHELLNELNPDAAWVVDGEGVATRKLDGTPVLIRDGQAFKRVTLKPGALSRPEGWEPAQDDPGVGVEWPGWVPIGDGKEDAPIVEAIDASGVHLNGTYELIGPKVNGNKEGLREHRLVRHGEIVLSDVPTDFDGLRAYLTAHDTIEGIVWHHPDGRMAKIKGRDFHIRRLTANDVEPTIVDAAAVISDAPSFVDTPRLSPRALRDGGYLQEVNRRFFHPLGLALAVAIHDSPEGEDIPLPPDYFIVIDGRDDPEGFYFAPEPGMLANVDRIDAEWDRRAEARELVYGFVVQPPETLA